MIELPDRVNAIMKQLEVLVGDRNEATVEVVEANAESTTNPCDSSAAFTADAVSALAPMGIELTASRMGSSP